MLIDAINILILGMSVVFVFLMVLTLMIYFQAFLFRKHAKSEEEFMTGESSRRRSKKALAPSSSSIQKANVDEIPLAAIISAAVSMHRSKRSYPQS